MLPISMEADNNHHSSNPTYISPTDNLMTPCTQKLSAAKKKHFTKFVNSPVSFSVSLTTSFGYLGARNRSNYLLSEKIKANIMTSRETQKSFHHRRTRRRSWTLMKKTPSRFLLTLPSQCSGWSHYAFSPCGR